MVQGGLLKIGSVLNVLAATWMMILAFVILADVLGRGFFNMPLQGTAEIVANSVVAIVFLQFPFAVSSRGMIYTPLLIANLPFNVKKLLTFLAFISGAAVFAAIAYSSYPNMIRAWHTSEYMSEGALRVPTVYTRATIIFTSVLCCLAYLSLAWNALVAKPETGSADVMP
jgi:TRAP-type C4-dicarboxylate transport system permease small subunit